MNFHTDHRALVAAAALGYLVLTIVIAVLPAFDLQKTVPHPGQAGLSAEEARGRELYLKEGCGFCHTQFVRDLQLDNPYGRGSVAADYAMERPPLLGTQRTGPDLANVGIRQPSEVWNLIHLYDPRAVVAQSVMPAYPWYFELKGQAGEKDVVVLVPEAISTAGQVVVATDDAIAIVRYLQTLKQPEMVK